MYFISVIIGLIIVISSLFFIRREFMRSIRVQNQMIEQSQLYKGEDLFGLLENLQISLDTMNQAFYEIANDLEGKYSLHEKEISDLREQILGLANIQSLSSMDKVQLVVPNPTTELEDPLISQIEKLKNEGKTLVQIAKELGIGYGELQLLMSIKK